MSKLTKVLLSAGAAALLVIVSLQAITLSQPGKSILGSVGSGGDYQSTTTTATWPAIVAIHTGTCATRCPGMLGSVIMTKTDTGIITFYDATTTDVNKRQASMASTSILMAVFPASPTAQVYTFDSAFKNGLIMVTSGSAASSTITYRQYGDI